jgi:hypothetical protein
MPEADDLDYEGYDNYISACLWLPNADGIATAARVTHRKWDNDGHLIGKSNCNPLLDTSLYEVEFDDGRVGTYSANVIAQNIFEQVDADGHAHAIFDDIIDHRKGTDAVSSDEGFVIHSNRRLPNGQHMDGHYLCNGKMGLQEPGAL